MKNTDYDGENTAAMVGMDLMATLGLSKKRVGEVFHHYVYDGVYAMPEERVHGGGSLSLTKHFAEWCEMEQGDFTGLWDMGHKLQLVYGDVLLKEKKIKDLNKLIFNTMGDFLHGKAALLFKELADELNQPVLANKGPQETRWVRATLTALVAFMRNLVTFGYMYGRQEIGFATENNATKQKEAMNKRNSLSNGEMISLAVGVIQVLDSYSAASLSSQHAAFFPTSVIKAIQKFEANLMIWKTNWTWSSDPLNYASIGIPASVIENLKRGVYTPNLSDSESAS